MQSMKDISRLFASGETITVRNFGEFLSEGLAAPGDVGSVYRLTRREDFGDGKSYAVKVIGPSVWKDEQRMAQLSEACSAIACVRYPHVCAIEGLFYAVPTAAPKPGVPIIFMEYLVGFSLRQCFDVAGTDLSPLARYQIATQLIGGLEALHKAKVVHGDIRPETVLLTDPGDGSRGVKLVQFSAAHIAANPIRAARLGDTAPQPSAALGAAAASTMADDIRSLSLVLYELLSTRRPFADIGSDDRSTMRPTPLRDIAPEVPADVAHEIDAGLSKDPHDRPSTPAYVAPFRRMVHRLLREGAAGSLNELRDPPRLA